MEVPSFAPASDARAPQHTIETGRSLEAESSRSLANRSPSLRPRAAGGLRADLAQLAISRWGVSSPMRPPPSGSPQITNRSLPRRPRVGAGGLRAAQIHTSTSSTRAQRSRTQPVCCRWPPRPIDPRDQHSMRVLQTSEERSDHRILVADTPHEGDTSNSTRENASCTHHASTHARLASRVSRALTVEPRDRLPTCATQLGWKGFFTKQILERCVSEARARQAEMAPEFQMIMLRAQYAHDNPRRARVAPSQELQGAAVHVAAGGRDASCGRREGAVRT